MWICVDFGLCLCGFVRQIMWVCVDFCLAWRFVFFFFAGFFAVSVGKERNLNGSTFHAASSALAPLWPPVVGSLDPQSFGSSLSMQFWPVVPIPQGQPIVPLASQQFRLMEQGFPSNVALPAGPTVPSSQAVNDPILNQPSSSDWAVHFYGGRRYYHNMSTGKTTWEQPLELMAPMAVNDPSLHQHSSSDWAVYFYGGRRYYHNKSTGKTTWDRPLELMAPMAVNDPSHNQHSSSDWAVYFDRGKRYYHNKSTGKTTWDQPLELRALMSQPVVPSQQGQTCVPLASQQFQPMVQGFTSNVAMPASPSQPLQFSQPNQHLPSSPTLPDHAMPSSQPKKQLYIQANKPLASVPLMLKPRISPVTNHVSGLQQNDISASSQFQPMSQMPAPAVHGKPWYSYKHQMAALATPVLQTGQQPSVIPSKDSAINVPSLYQHSSSDWREHTRDGQRFYFNLRTKECSWEKPLELTSIDLVCEQAHKAVSQGTQSGTSVTTPAPDVTVSLAQTSVATISVSSTTTSTFAGVALRPVPVSNPSPVVSGSSAVSSPQSAVPAIAVGNQPPVLAASPPVSAVSGSIGVPAASINANPASMSHFENLISQDSQGSVDGASVQDIEAKNEKEKGEKEKWKVKGRKENEREREKGKERSKKDETDCKTVDVIDSHSYKEDKKREKDKYRKHWKKQQSATDDVSSDMDEKEAFKKSCRRGRDHVSSDKDEKEESKKSRRHGSGSKRLRKRAYSPDSDSENRLKRHERSPRWWKKQI